MHHVQTFKGPSIIVNIKLHVQNIVLGGGGGQWKKNIDSVFFQHFSPLLLPFNVMARYAFEYFLMCTLFEGGRGLRQCMFGTLI